MAIPSEYQAERTTGATNLAHPLCWTAPQLERRAEESIGPLTNLRTGTVLHPDMHDTDPDRGRINAGQHEHQFSTWLPGQLAGSNVVHKGDPINSYEELVDHTVTIRGQEATYVVNEYGANGAGLIESSCV